MVSQNDVAKRAGVSNAVVSYVVNNGPRPTSEETRKKVLTAIKELGYRTNNVARSLKTNSSKVIGLLIPDSANAFFSEVAKGIEDELYKRGYTVMFGNTAGDMKRQVNYVETFISQMVDGVIFVTTPLPEEQLSDISAFSIPVIVIDPESNLDEKIFENISVVSVDGERGGFLAGEYLIKQGHKRMAVIAGAQKVPPATVRVAGFTDALSRESLEVEVVWAGDHPNDGYQAARKLLLSTDSPTAIFACNDLLALGILRAAVDLKIQIPEELAIIGFDDIDIANFLCPRLTTICQPKYEMGQIAAKYLLKKIKNGSSGSNEQSDTTPPGITLLDTELIIRESA